MQPSNLKTVIESNFHFLVDDFGFLITTERYEQEMGNAVVIFTNQYASIEIVKDRGDILVSLGTQTLARREWGEFAEVIQFLSENSGTVYVLPAQDSNATDESQISRIASLMRKYCEPIFSGKVTMNQLLSAMLSKRSQETREFINTFFDASSQG